jgi:transketolase
VLVSEGSDVTVIAVGTMVSRAVDAAERLRADGISARVINMPFVDPLDAATVLDAARETRGIVTVEEGIVSGGLGAAVASLVAQHQPVPMRILGITGFAPTGSASYLLDHFGLTADGIASAAHELV